MKAKTPAKKRVYKTGTPGAPKGNRFWELRSKHGRDKLFASPLLLWEAACEYFAWCEKNPLIELDWVGKDAKKVEKPKMRPYTMQGLCLYLDCNVGYFNDFQARIKEGKDKDFSAVLTRVRETIFNQKFTGAASGFLNPHVIMRDLGLTDKKDVTSAGQAIGKVDLSKLSPEELKALAKLQAKVNAK